MVKLSLGGNSYRSKRYRKRGSRGSKYRYLTASRSFQSYAPRSLYSMLPAQMKVAQRLCGTYAVIVGGLTNPVPNPVDGTGYFNQQINLCDPNPALVDFTTNDNRRYPEYFSTLMALYSRSVIDRVQIRLTFSNASGVPLNAVAAIIPQGDNLGINQIALPDAFMRVRSYPEAKTVHLGVAGSGKDTMTMYLEVDIKKFLNYADETIYTTYSQITNAAVNAQPAVGILVPVAANIPQSPRLYFMIQNTQNAGSSVFISYDLTYHITYSSRHPGGVSNTPV